MASFTVDLPGGGQMTVNASSPSAAIANAGGGGTIGVLGHPAGGGGQTINTPSINQVPAAGGGGPSAANIAAMANQLKAVGWQGNPNDSNAVIAAFKATATPSDVAAMMGGGGTDQSNSGMGPLSPWEQAQVDAFTAAGGISIKQMQQNAEQFAASLQLQRDQMEKIGIPQLEINKRLADATIAFQQSQMQIAQQNEKLQEGIVSGVFNGQPTEAARQFNQNQALQYLTQASQFAASDPFQLSDFMRGASLQPGVPQFLKNLQSNVTGGAAGNVGPNAAPAMTLGDLNSAMAGTGPPINPQTDPALAATGGIYNQGASHLGVGTLESLTQQELATFQQGINRLYGSQAGPAFLQQYQATRPMQAATRTASY
jgi:hypothetical protein